MDDDIADLIEKSLFGSIPQMPHDEQAEVRIKLLSLLYRADEKYNLETTEEAIGELVEIMMSGDPRCILCHDANAAERLEYLPAAVRELIINIREQVPPDGFFLLGAEATTEPLQNGSPRQKRFVCGGLCIAGGAFAVGALSSFGSSAASGWWGR